MRGAADHEIGVAGVVREEVEPHDLVRAGRYAPILHVVIVCGKRLRADSEVAHARDEIDTHRISPRSVSPVHQPQESQRVLR